MSKPRKAKPNEFEPLITQAITRITDAATSLTDAKAAAQAAKNQHAIAVLNRLIIHALAIGKGAKQLIGQNPPPANPKPPTTAA